MALVAMRGSLCHEGGLMGILFGIFLGVLLCLIFTPQEVVNAVYRWCRTALEWVDEQLNDRRTDNRDT